MVATTGVTNHQRVTEGFQILTAVLAPYVAQELRVKFAVDPLPPEPVRASR